MIRRGWIAILGGLGYLIACIYTAEARPENVPSRHPVDLPISLMKQAKEAYAKITDYQCMMIKQETIDGVLGANQIVELKVKPTPFSVYMKWQAPAALAGQEASYIDGKHDGKMRCKPAGLLGSIGFISISPDDPRCKKTSNHPITRAGIGYLIESCLDGWTKERELNATHVKVGTFTYAKRRCTRVEMIHPSSLDGKLHYYRNVVYFDQETKLPIRVENYGWPKKDGEKAPLVEVFSYVNLRTNLGLPQTTFDK